MKPEDQDTSAADSPATRSAPAFYQTAVGVAVIAGIFSVVVAALMLNDFNQRRAEDPLEVTEYQDLKAKLAMSPQDEEIKSRLRAMDLRLRKVYFTQRRFTRAGSWLLLAGVIVLFVGAKSALVLRQKLPMPEPQAISHDPEAKTMSTARWSVTVLAVVLAVGTLSLSRGLTSELPTAEALAAMQNADPPAPPEPPPAPPAIGYPPPEAFRGNWARFRGPSGLGISHHNDVPTTWDGESGEGILWKTPVPLEGNSSPVLWDDRVFLTGATEAKQEVYCFDALNGELLWQKDVPLNPEAVAEPIEVMEDTGYAAPTMVTDGQAVFAMFVSGDVAAFDFDGNSTWTRSLGIPDNCYGHAASLAMYENLLLVQFDQGSSKDDLSKMLALDGTSGETVWEVARKVPNSWPSPIVVPAVDGSPRLITCSDPWVIVYDPSDGREIWRAKVLEADVGPSPVVAGGRVYVANEFPGISALATDGEGDVTETHLLWQGEDGVPDTATPVATEEYVYTLASYGILTCYDATSGEILWEAEFDGSFTSSPSLVGNRLYLFDFDGKAWVVEPGPEGITQVAENDLGEECVTSPAFANGRFYIRGREHLFCMGKE